MQKIIVIGGPTASGKTALAIALAQHLNTVILSADSRQFYKEMSIGTAKPSAVELAAAKHYFIDSHSIHNPVSAAQFEKEALQLISSELKHLPYLILVGGSGMFIDALCVGLDPIPRDEKQQEELRKELELNGLDPLLEELARKDPTFYSTVDTSNPVRILRALEVIRSTNKTFSSWRMQQPEPRPFHIQRFTIDIDRNTLYERINKRVEQMVENGLFEEVKELIPFEDITALQTVGYKEVFDYYKRKISKAETIALIQQHTRNYAKRQLTWFRRHQNTVWLNSETLTSQIQTVINNL